MHFCAFIGLESQASASWSHLATLGLGRHIDERTEKDANRAVLFQGIGAGVDGDFILGKTTVNFPQLNNGVGAYTMFKDKNDGPIFYKCSQFL